MKLFSVYSADDKFIGSWTALGPEDAITKAKQAIQQARINHNKPLEWPSLEWKEPFVAKLFRYYNSQ